MQLQVAVGACLLLLLRHLGALSYNELKFELEVEVCLTEVHKQQQQNLFLLQKMNVVRGVMTGTVSSVRQTRGP